MGNIIQPNTNKILPKELIELQSQAQKEFATKSLSALAVLVMGICAIILLNSNFLAIGVAITLISSIAIYQYFSQYCYTKNMISKAIAAVFKTL